MASTVTLALLAALVGSGPGAIPAPESTPVVVIEQCPEVDVTEVQRLLGLELELSPAAATPPTRVLMRCEDDAVILEARDPARSTLVTRDVPRSRGQGAERAYALALHQLLTRPPPTHAAPTSPISPTPSHARDEHDPPAPDPAPAASPSVDATPRTWLEIGLGGLARSLDRDPLPSGRVELELIHWFDPNLGIVGVVAAEVGGTDRRGGTALAWNIAAGPGVALRSPQRRGWSWMTRLTVPLGYGNVRGRADQGFFGTAVGGFTADALLRTGAQWTSNRLALGIDALAGLGLYQPRGLVNDDEPVTMGGVVLGAMLSAAIGLGS